MTEQDITFPSPGADGREAAIKALLAQPQASDTSPSHGSVIVVHEIFGLTDHIKSVARRLAEAGFTALAVDFFSREGGAPDMSQGFQGVREFVGKIPDRQIMSDIGAGARYLQQLPQANGKVGVVGFCWGGRIGMLADASVPEIAAAVAYYGRISGEATANQPAHPIDLAADMNIPLLGHFGETDAGIPPAEAEKLRAALQVHRKPHDIYVYEGAGHAFNNDTRESYHAAAAHQAWERTLAWFARYLT
ncbi:MAG TPA: dienelactone hydrolase family protein [Chthonomonadaceae bacterium]|nr:dienelactone hydrolase family protein [Chthonomonadaceae bacterium]